jgi:hypothetical protein
MGKAESKVIHMIPSETLASYQDEYKMLGLQEKDICLLHNIFRDIYSSNEQYELNIHDEEQQQQMITATIQLPKLLKYFSLEQTSFTELLFMSFDVDVFFLDSIDFPRFLQAIWNFCTLEDEALSTIPFTLRISISLTLLLRLFYF